MDDELLQDFLIEAGEILEQLNEQLVDLENSPDDMDLLNAVFRGFHTIKGGAGFLNLEPMVVVCHRAEDVFNLLRNGERQVDANLMDIILPVLDVLNVQFEALRSGEEPEHAEPSLIEALERIIAGEEAAPGVDDAADSAGEAAAAEADAEAVEAPAGDSAGEGGNDAGAESDMITDEEFEALLDALEKPDSAKLDDTPPAAEPPQAAAGGAASDEITEDEFEALLDELHGKGKFVPDKVASPDAAPAAEATPPDKDAADSGAAGDDEITEDEFEALLDELHGKGKFSPDVATDQKATPAAEAKEPAKKTPEKKAAAKPAAKPAAKKQEDKKAADKPTAKPAARAEAKGERKDKPAAQGESTVRVDTGRLDDIMNLVGELVLVRNRIARLGSSSEDEEMLKAVANLDVVTADLQLSVMKTRMQPIKKVFGRFPRVVRDMARSLKKEIKLELVGEDTDLDKNLVEALSDPLVHLVRNAVDHGIEMPDEREAAGKPRTGHVVLAAAQEGDHILLTIEDDGKGMDAEVLRRKAVEKGLMDREAAARLDDKECFNLIFMPGFSTKDEISDISGRGVGMDVVKTRIAQLNGTVEIDSVPGKGSRLSIKVPLTLAIMPTLMVKLETQLFALPLVNVSEIFHLDLTQTNIVDGQLVVVVREKTLPLFSLTQWLVKNPQSDELPSEGHVVVVHIGTQKVGFIVDELIGQEEVVIKPLGEMLHGTQGLAGATITGDGAIAIILDVPGLLRAYGRRF